MYLLFELLILLLADMASKSETWKSSDSICSDYRAGISSTEIAKRYNCTSSLVLSILKSNGVKMRKSITVLRKDLIPVNHDFFETIDTEAKAWCLGLMFSDGTVNSIRPEVSLSMTDLDVIELFRSCVGHNVRILECTKKDVKYKQGYQVRVSSYKMKNDLIRHGCTPRKSLTLQFPTTVPDDLIRHFIRGYFDGDGSITVSSKTRRASFTGSYSFIKSLKSKLNNENINCGIKIQNAHGADGDLENTFEIKIGDLSLRLLKKYMYMSSNYSMNRKRIKFDMI